MVDKPPYDNCCLQKIIYSIRVNNTGIPGREKSQSSWYKCLDDRYFVIVWTVGAQTRVYSDICLFYTHSCFKVSWLWASNRNPRSWTDLLTTVSVWISIRSFSPPVDEKAPAFSDFNIEKMSSMYFRKVERNKVFLFLHQKSYLLKISTYST